MDNNTALVIIIGVCILGAAIPASIRAWRGPRNVPFHIHDEDLPMVTYDSQGRSSLGRAVDVPQKEQG